MTSPTPEPGSLVLFGIGLLGVAVLWARKLGTLRSPQN
ncbi:MAG: PEP-CTERM sorting domain-containing protein [Terriglobia bacterium]